MTTFSLIIPTHRRPRTLRRALESVRAQTFSDVQVIVVSDTSDQESAIVADEHLRDGDAYVRRYGVPGPAASRNLALQLVAGEYVIFLDDDDTLLPSFLEQVAQAMLKMEPGEIAYTNFEVIHEQADEASISRETVDIGSYPSWYVYVKNFIPNNCVIYPKKAIEGVFFDPEVAYEDWEFLLAATARGQLVHLPFVGPCVHKNSVSESRGESNNSRLLDCYIHIYRKYPPIHADVARQREKLFQMIGLNIHDIINK